MAAKWVYVVLVREKGLFLVEPVEGMSQGAAVEAALGMKGGYSAGKVSVDLPDGADEAWVAWVEGQGPNDQPYFLFHAFDPTLSEEQVEAILKERGEEPLKLNRSQVYRPEA